MKVIHNLEPIYDEFSQILILGSMPSKKSHEKFFYYANPKNRFWPILEKLFNVKLESNEEKKNFLLQNHIALWDVIKSCDITGSSDASIKNVTYNDIQGLINKTNIKCIFCTGKTAYNYFTNNFYFNIPTFYLPSPSSANATFDIDSLVLEYQKIKKNLD